MYNCTVSISITIVASTPAISMYAKGVKVCTSALDRPNNLSCSTSKQVNFPPLLSLDTAHTRTCVFALHNGCLAKVVPHGGMHQAYLQPSTMEVTDSESTKLTKNRH